jgi:hypothetical protein
VTVPISGAPGSSNGPRAVAIRAPQRLSITPAVH